MRTVFCWSLKFNTKLSPRHPQWSRHCERLGKLGALKKEIWALLRARLFLGKRCGVTTYFFVQKRKKEKKKKEKTKYKIHDQNTSSSLIE